MGYNDNYYYYHSSIPLLTKGRRTAMTDCSERFGFRAQGVL